MRNAQIEIADMAGQIDALRHALELQMDELRAFQSDLAARVRATESAIQRLETKPEPSPAPAPAAQEKPTAAASPLPKTQAQEGIGEEIMLVIAAAVAAFVGKSARVRSARYLQEGQSSWAQQGRVFVQASHNLAHHG